jgi:hypothetical protein
MVMPRSSNAWNPLGYARAPEAAMSPVVRVESGVKELNRVLNVDFNAAERVQAVPRTLETQSVIVKTMG